MSDHLPAMLVLLIIIAIVSREGTPSFRAMGNRTINMVTITRVVVIMVYLFP